jgi:hypothetical protein
MVRECGHVNILEFTVLISISVCAKYCVREYIVCYVCAKYCVREYIVCYVNRTSKGKGTP